jgi:hypothetical protein
MARMGARYPEVIEMLHQAGSCKCLSCELAVDALPQAITVKELAKAGIRSKGKEIDLDEDGSDAEIRQAQSEFGITPNIFQKDASRRSPRVKPAAEETASE